MTSLESLHSPQSPSFHSLSPDYPLHSPLKLLNALLAIYHSSPTLISAPSIFQSAHTTPHPTPSSSPPPCPTSAHRLIGSNRRASVAIIIRIAPSSRSPPSTPASSPSTPPDPFHPAPTHRAADLPSQLRAFFAQPWVQAGEPELFLIKRATRANDRWSAHVAFPGGRMEPEDEDGLFCAMRETWEEVGIDLAEREFLQLGRLDDREITTSLGKRLLMVLSPYVFLCTREDGGPEPALEPGEVAAAYWVPLRTLAGADGRWGEVTIDLSARLAPSRGPLLRLLLRSLVGSMRFRSLLLPDTPVAVAAVPGPAPRRPTDELHLWGLTLGMTLDLLSFLEPGPHAPPRPAPVPAGPLDWLNAPPPAIAYAAPSMACIFPRFTHLDINALIWLLGRRYRKLIRQWATSTRQQVQSQADSRQLWTGRVMNEFYRSVRKALIVGMINRLVIIFGGMGWFGWWVARKKLGNFGKNRKRHE